jgi:hypothetical protein
VGKVIVVLPHDAIIRILDRASATPSGASEVGSYRTPSALPGEAGPALSENLIGALDKAKTDKVNLVGPLEMSDFNALSAWCRSVGLTRDGEIVEAAVRTSG